MEAFQSNLIHKYEHFISVTAIYPTTLPKIPEYSGLQYARLGLIGEYGEIANKIKKVYRDNDGNYTEDVRNAILSEIGDCYWYIAAICKETNISFSANFFASKRYINPIDKNLFSSLYKAHRYITQICEEIDPDLINANTRSLLSVLGYICQTLNSSAEQVIENNISKLYQRKQNNTIKGSGDER